MTIISLRDEVWAHNTPPLFIEVTVPSHESQGSCICVLGVSIHYFDIWFWNCPDMLLFVLRFFSLYISPFRDSRYSVYLTYLLSLRCIEWL